MRFFSLLTNIVTHVQLIAAFNVLAVSWPDGLRELVIGLRPFTLDLAWVQEQFPSLPPFPLRLRNLLTFALLPFVCLFVAVAGLAVMAAPQLVLFVAAICQIPFAAMYADDAIEIVIVALIGTLALLSNPIFLCKFNDPEDAPGWTVTRVIRRTQDAFPPVCFIGGAIVAYVGRDADTLIVTGSILSVIGAVATISVVAQHATPAGRIDRYSRICRLSTFLGRQTMGLVFFSFNAAVIPVLTLGLESVTFIEYACPEGTLFNPYVMRPQEEQYSTSPALFCDPCVFSDPSSCRQSAVAAGISNISQTNLTAAMCPAWKENRLALDPMTHETSSWLYAAVLLVFLAYGLVLLMLFLCSMRRGIADAARAFGPSGALANVDIAKVAAQRAGEDDDGEDSKRTEGGEDGTIQVEDTAPMLSSTVSTGGASAAVLDSTSLEPSEVFGGGTAEGPARWEFVCDSVEAKVFEFCSDFRYPMRYTYVLQMMHKVLIVVASVPVAPSSSVKAAAGMATVHGLMLLFMIAARPFRSALLTRLTLAELICEFLVGVFAAVSADDSGKVSPGVGYAVLIVNIVLPIVAVVSTVSELKGKLDEYKEKKRRREAFDKEEALLSSDSGYSPERGGEMSPVAAYPPPPPPPAPPLPAAGGGSITVDGQQPGYYPPPQGYAAGGPGPQGYPSTNPYAPGAPPPQHQAYGVPGYGQAMPPPLPPPMQYGGAPAPAMMPVAAQRALGAAQRREQARRAAEALPEAKVAAKVDGRSKWLITIPAFALLVPVIGFAIYALINSAREGALGIPTLDSTTEFLQSVPTVEDPLAKVLGNNPPYGAGNWSRFVGDACCLEGSVTSASLWPEGDLPRQERWIWLDTIYSKPPRRRVINHARVDMRQHDPLGSNGAFGVNGFWIRPMCGSQFAVGCQLEQLGGDVDARCSNPFNTSQRWPPYALQYLW